MKPRFACVATAASMTLIFASYTQAQTYNNSTADGLSWGTAGNWTPATVPNAIDAEAILNGAGPSGTAPATLALDVLLNGNFTIGKFTRSVNGGQAATFPTTPTGFDATKGLTLQKTTGTPEINVVGDVFFYSAVFGTQGLEKTNTGRFTFRFNTIDQTYTGPIKISGGTLGIQKDRSLGDVNNDIEITPTTAVDSTLFAEPGNNTDAITLPATRTITLNDPNNIDLFDPCLSSTAAAVVFTIDGDIGEVASSGCFLKKTGAGVVVLNGTNSWTGGTIINAGVLTATKPAAFPNYATQYCNVTGTSTLAVRYGDAWSWTDTEIGNLLGNSNLTFATGAGFGIDTTGNAGAATFAGNIAPPNFSKIGPGTLILSDPQTTISGLSLYGGTLQLGTSSSLPAGITFKNLAGGTTLNLGGTTASFTDLQEVSGGTTTITNGSLTFNGAFNCDVNGTDQTKLNLSGLASFTYDSPTKAFRVLPATSATTATNECLLASSGAGTNVVNALSVGIGGASGTSQGTSFQGQLRLGVSNTFNTPNFTVGGFNGSGLVTYQSGLTTPSFKLRGADTTSAATLLKVGETSSGVRSGAGTLDLTGGLADISATDIVVGRHIAGSNNGDTSSMTVPAGTVTATTLLLAEKTGGGSPAMASTFNQRGTANVSVDTISLGQTSTSPSSVQFLSPTYNLEGGTLTTAEIKPGTLATAPAPAAQVETATAAGTITAAGTVSVTVTGAGITGSPLVIPVTVANGDTATVWAGKVVTALAATPAITALYNVTNSTTAIVLTRITTGVYDGTLNVALANGTCTGVTAAATSANTNANVLSNINRTVKLHGGTLINKVGGNLNISGPTPPLATGNNPTTILIPGNTTAIVDSTAGSTVNFTNVAFSTRINSATPSAGTLQVDGDVVITTSTLAVIDDAPTNAVAVAPGTKLVLIDYQDGSLTGTFTGIADGDTVSVTKGAVTNAFIIDYNDPAYGGKAVTLTIPGSANNYASWANDPLKGNIPGEPAGGDFDNDGLTNIVEYALGKNPRVSSMPAGVMSGNTITFTKGSDAIANADVSWTIETSTTLAAGSWTDAVTQAAGNTAPAISFTFTPGSPVKNFARLKVVQVP